MYMSVNDQIKNSCSILVCKEIKYILTLSLAASEIIYLARESLSEDDGAERYEALGHIVENIGDLVRTIERKINEHDGFFATAQCETTKKLDRVAIEMRLRRVCEVLGLPKSEVHRALSNDAESLLEFAHATGQSLDWLAYGDEAMIRDRYNAKLNAERSERTSIDQTPEQYYAESV